MKIQEIKDPNTGEVVFNLVQNENDLDLKVLDLLARYVFDHTLRTEPESVKDFVGKIVFNLVDDTIRPCFMHVTKSEEDAEKVLEKIKNNDEEYNKATNSGGRE